MNKKVKGQTAYTISNNLIMKKVLKRTAYFLLSLIVILVVAALIYVSYWRNSSTIDTFHTFNEPEGVSYSNISWQGEYLDGKKVEKYALYLPVKIKGLKGNLFMQFDSGTERTVIYGKTLSELLKSDNSVETYYNSDSVKYMKNPMISIGDSELITEKIRISSKMGSSEIDTTQILIGTLGFDVFVDRTLILDFKRDRLAVTQKQPEELDYDLTYVDKASVDKFPLLVPAKIGSKKTRLYYDTGSSMFPIITSNKRLEKLNKNRTDSLCCITNWGREYLAYQKELNEPIKIGESTYENQSVYSTQVLDMVNYVPSWFIYGLTGNQLFEDKVLVIDTRSNLMGIEN